MLLLLGFLFIQDAILKLRVQYCQYCTLLDQSFCRCFFALAIDLNVYRRYAHLKDPYCKIHVVTNFSLWITYCMSEI